MYVNPNCPKCKTNRRVIVSHKGVVFTPGRSKRFVVSFLTKIINICTSIVDKAVRIINHIHRQRHLYKCNICNEEFLGTRKQQR